MNPLRPLILDLDFTLLHLEWRPDSLEVPGRTRSAWIAPQTVDLLHELQGQFDVILATARSWDGTRWVWEGLAARGVQISAAVIEDGALFGRPDDWQCMDTAFQRDELQTRVEAPKSVNWPLFEWQDDFQACLVARCDDADNASRLFEIFRAECDWREANLRFYRDGRKVYLLPRGADKWSALTQLLGERAPIAAGVGDGLNDLIWLAQVKTPCTLSGAVPQIVDLVRQRGGYLSPQCGHEGICDVLRHLLREK